MFGENFNLKNDEEILKINSPQSSLEGPYVVVYKSIAQRWVIVTMNWDDAPTLGIRWFWGKNGNPISRSYATWLVIPSMLHNAVLNGLPLEFAFRDKVNRFLVGEIDGATLKRGGYAK
ncbi:MAG TPA: hypothetical protein PKL52_01730 [Tenuifilaceae bacterium]|nr:hypothetical protein [Tenuifilaceae bacterium]